MIDEKLAYHYYLSSDKSFDQIPVIDVKDKRRADLLIFNNPIAFADQKAPYGSIVIVELQAANA